MNPTRQRSAADWPAIRRLYEATTRGDFSTRQIARGHGITETAIRKRAKIGNWLRRDQWENLAFTRRDKPDLKDIDRGRRRLGMARSAKQSGPARDHHVMGDAPMPTAEKSAQIRARASIRPLVRRDVPSIGSQEAQKVNFEELQDILCQTAEFSLLCQLADAIANRDSLIAMIGEWHQDTGGKMVQYAALQKALDLKQLSSVLRSTAETIKIIDDLSRRADRN